MTADYLSAYFVTNSERMQAVLEEPLILLYEKKLSAIQDLVPVLEQIAKAGRPSLILAEDVFVLMSRAAGDSSLPSVS